jgi:hypothetical protein
MDETTDKVNEPIVEYGNAAKKRISFFNSFEEAAEADHEFYRNLTPLQRMEIHYELTLRFSGKPISESNKRFSF